MNDAGQVFHETFPVDDDAQKVELLTRVHAQDCNALWVFGYGSLCWKPGFVFDKAVVGHVRGFSRKFWQGNDSHRGSKHQLGRVATLIDDDKSSVYGVAFAVSGESAIPYLTKRECTLGGYDTRFTTFYPAAGSPIKVLLYIATPMNSLWLGDAPAWKIAEEICRSKGESGYNAEYLLRLANFMRFHFPNESDTHLFSIEKELQGHASKLGIDLRLLMGNGDGCVTYVKETGLSRSAQRTNQRNRDEVDRRDENRETFQFIARVPEKALRCLNI